MTYLVPPIVIVLGWALLGEAPAPLAIGGGALCIGGVIIARSKGRPRIRRRATESGAAAAAVFDPDA
jgi:drug/metabolite transporter (DMT)-like permease